MSIPGKVLIALLSALLVAVAASFLDPRYDMLAVFIPSAVASLLAVVLSHRALPVPGAISDTAGTAATAAPAAGTPKDSARRDKPAEKSGPERNKRSEQQKSPGNRNGRRAKTDKTRAPSTTADASAAKDNAAREPAVPSPGSASSAPLEEGTVKWFNVSKGYGFIIRDNGDEIFVHHRSVQGDGRGRLDDGSSVRFRVVTTDKGPQAEDVEPL